MMDTPNESEISAVLTLRSGVSGTAHINNDSVIEEMVFLDTIPAPPEAAGCPKLKYLSVAPLFAAAINNIREGTSVSYLFN